jgi:hypothetical protein
MRFSIVPADSGAPIFKARISCCSVMIWIIQSAQHRVNGLTALALDYHSIARVLAPQSGLVRSPAPTWQLGPALQQRRF